MKKFFKFGRSKKDGPGSATASTESLAATGYLVKEKEISKLHKAAWTGDLAKVKQLAKKDPSALDKENRTALHLACARGYVAIVQELLEWKVKVNIGDNDSRTPLIKAVECGHEDCAKLLLEANAEPNTKDKNGDAALHYGVRQGNTDMAALLLARRNTDIDVQNKERQTPLHISVSNKDDKMAKYLVDEGAELNIQDHNGHTPLMITCQDGNTDLTKLLIENGADLNLKDAKGWTADDIAIMASHDECRELLGALSARSKGPPTNNNSKPEAAGGAIGPSGAMFGGPVIDQGDDFSAGEETHSKLSEAGGVADSWADTDEESEVFDQKRKHSSDETKKSFRGSSTRSKPPLVDNIAEVEEDQNDEKVPGLDLTKLLKDSNDSLDDPDVSKIPKLSDPNVAANVNLKRSDSSTSATKSHIPVAKKDSLGVHPPVSARSSASVKSALSFGGNVDSNWSDDESLFSSSNDPKKKKAPLLKTKSPRQDDDPKTDPASEWSDDDAAGPAPQSGAKNINAIPVTPRSNDNKDSDAVGTPLATSTARGEKADDDLAAAEKHKPESTNPELLAELGLSDVDDVSDPDFDDESPPLSSKAFMPSFNNKPPSGRQRKASDDWETDTPRSSTKKKAPLSARSTGSNWDDSVAEDDEPPVKPNLAALGRGKQKSLDDGEEESQWDSDTDVPTAAGYAPTQPAANTPAAANTSTKDDSKWDSDSEIPDEKETTLPPDTDNKLLSSPPSKDIQPRAPQESLSNWDSEHAEPSKASQSKATSEEVNMTQKPIEEPQSGTKSNASKQEDSLWDSDVEDELAPPPLPTVAAIPPLPASPPPQLPPSSTIDKEILPTESSTKESVAKVTAALEKEDEENSAWDSEEEIATPRSDEVVLEKKTPVVKGGMFAADDDSEDDFEEEEESTWEKEKREKAALERQKSEEREAQWEAEYKQRQEQLRREAQEELKREKEEQERLRIEAEEEEDRKIEEEEERQKQKQEEEKKKLEEQKRLQDEEARKKQEEKELESQERKAQLVRSGAVSDDDEEEERSRQIRQRREHAEQNLAVAKITNQINGHHANAIHDDDDEDTFNDLDVADLDVTPMNTTNMARNTVVSRTEVVVSRTFRRPRFDGIASTNGGLPPSGGMYGATQPEDDALSYSSTEQEASIHEPLAASQGIHNTSQPLNLSFNSDSVNIVRMQESVRESRRLLDKERSTRTSMENKRKHLEKEKSELISKLEDVTRNKSHLEQNKIDLEAKIRTLQYEMSEESEQRRNAETLLNKTKEQLARKENQYTSEVEAKQKAELSMRNLQMELRTTMGSIKQLEDEKEDLYRQLQHEKNARMLQEQINDEQQKLSDELKAAESIPREKDELAQALSKLEEADENRKHAQGSVEKLRAELYATKMELDRHKARYKDDHSLLSSENEDLQTKIEELKEGIKLQEEALAHATMQYNIQLSQLKTENAVLGSSVEKEKATREKLDLEVESLRSRLSSTSAELEKSQSARSELERNNHKEHEEWNKLIERRDVELSGLKENNQNLSHRLGAAEAKVSAVENELHIANATLAERTNQLTTIQRELDQRRYNQDNLDESFRKDKEDNIRLSNKLETLSEKLTTMQHENLRLKQQIDEARIRDLGRDQGDQSEKLSNMLSTIRADNEKARTVLEEKNAMLQEQIVHLREETRNADSRRSNQEALLQRAQTELNDATRKMSVTEAALEVANRGKEQLELDRVTMRAEIDKLQSRLDEAREKMAEANAKSAHLLERLTEAEKSTVATSQQLMTQSADVHEFARSKSGLEAEVHRLELENARMEAALKHESSRVESLQRELTDSTQVRHTMEQLLSNLKTSNAHLDEKLTEAAIARDVASHDAEDTRNLWETEVKGRSKLGLRIAQLDREKQEALSQVDEEKRKTRKAMELKRSSESKVENELQKATQLQKEVATLKAHLKASKKRLRELDTSDNRINILQSDFNNERHEMERTISTVRRQLEEVQTHLTSEIDQKEKLEHKTRQLTSDLNNFNHMEKSYNKLDRAKRKLEDELASYKNHIDNNYIERSELDRIRAELEAKSRVELNAKLEEVNAYLEEQALARQKLDVMRDNNESEMRKDFDRTRKDLMAELNKLRTSHNESSTLMESRDFEAKRFKDLYESELKLRERLAEKLEHATEKATKAQLYMDRQFGSSGGALQNNWMSSSSPLMLGKVSPGHGVNDLSQKIKAELNRSIAKHMEKSPQIDISLPPRSTDDINLGAKSFNKASTDYLEVLKKNYMLS